MRLVCFLLGNSPASEFYMPTFQNTLSRLHRWVGVCRIYTPMKTEQSVPKCRHIKFRHRGITQKKAYNNQNMAKVWNQEFLCIATNILQTSPVSIHIFGNLHTHRDIRHPRPTGQWQKVIIHLELTTEIFMKDKGEVVTLNAVMRSGFGNGQGSC
jgi:hypothetical protein